MSRRMSGSSLSAGVEHVAALAARAGDHQHVDALGGVLRHRRRALAGLVVGVRVHRHQPQSFSHLHTCSRSRTGHHRQWLIDDGSRPSSCHRACVRPDGRSPRAAPPPGSRHRQVVGRRHRRVPARHALAIWLGLASTLGQVTWTDLGYSARRRPHRQRDVRRAPPDRPATSPASCSALDCHHGTVGAVTVTIPAGGEASVHRVTLVQTTTRP